MECPKCGSETYELTDKTGTVIFCEDLMCDWNSKNPTHQQRLDKVLEKFGILILLPIGISYDGERFYMVGTHKRKRISLDTVEHLIKDTEAQDE